MKLEITEIPTETTTEPKIVGGTFKIKNFCEVREAIETFMEEHNLSRASFRLDGIVKEQVDYRFEELSYKTGDNKNGK